MMGWFISPPATLYRGVTDFSLDGREPCPRPHCDRFRDRLLAKAAADALALMDDGSIAFFNDSIHWTRRHQPVGGLAPAEGGVDDVFDHLTTGHGGTALL